MEEGVLVNKNSQINNNEKLTNQTSRGNWELSPQFLVRMTGFPIELMERLEFANTVRQINRLINSSTWISPTEGIMLHEKDIDYTFRQELDEQIYILREIMASTPAKEAVFLSNSHNFPLIERWINNMIKSPSKIRSGTTTLALYLQRFCMKNDSASFFGPCYWGKIAPEIKENLMLSLSDQPKAHRAAFFSHWAANAVAEWASNFPSSANAIRPRLVPTVRWVKDSLHGVKPEIGQWSIIDTPPNLSKRAIDLLKFIDGERNLNEIIRDAKIDVGEGDLDIHNLIDLLVENNLIFAHLEIPVGLYEPMEFLRDQLYQAGVVEAIPVVSKLLDLKQAFVSADFESRKQILTEMEQHFQDVTGVNPNRGMGQHYADRSILYEDASRNFAEFKIGHNLAHECINLSPVWDMLWIITEYDQQISQEIMINWFNQRFPGQQKTSFINYAQAFIEDFEVIQALLLEAHQKVQQIIQEIYTELVPPDLALQPVIKHDITKIQQITDKWGLQSPQGAILNPDILIAAKGVDDINAGEYQIVLGEIHGSVDLLTHSPLTYFLTDVERSALQQFVSRQYSEICPSNEIIVDVVRLHLRKTSAQLILAGPHIEAQGRSPKLRSEVIALADLEVHQDQGKLRLYSPIQQIYLRLSSMRVPNGSPERTSLLRPFALPEREGVFPLPSSINYCPRIEVGKLVLLRQTWRLHYQEWHYTSTEVNPGWDVNLFAHMLRLRQHLGLPKHVFAKIKGEPKPVFLDFHNYFLVHAFYKLWRKHKNTVMFTEAKPDISDTWLQDDDGHYSCELRMGFFRKST